MEFKCSVCDYSSFYRYSLERHIEKQKKCGDNPSIIEIPANISCEYCNKQYKTHKNLIQHLKICKIKKSSLEKELESVKKELNELKQTKSININSNNNNNNTTINNITIQLRAYNDPVLPNDMDDIYEEAWEKQGCVQTYIERVYFNEEHPENHNMCITNLRSKYSGKVFNGRKWETKDQNQLVDEMFSNGSKSLNTWVNKTTKRKDRYKDFISNVSQYKKESKNEVRLLLYDVYKNGLVNIKSTKAKEPDLIEGEQDEQDEQDE